MTATGRIFALLFTVAAFGQVMPARAANLPPANPYLADSHWPLIHGGVDAQKSSPYAGPPLPAKDAGRRLADDEIRFKPLGPIELISLNWSGPYPDGRRAIWVGSHQHLVKLDGETLETLSTYVMRQGNYLGAAEVARINRRYDGLVAQGDFQGLFDLADQVAGSRLRDEHMGNCYAFTNNDNERVFYFKDGDSGRRYLRFFGDAVEGDIESPIELKREWEIPDVDGRPFIPFAFSMTFDGWTIMASNTGILMALSQDLSEYRTLDLAAHGGADPALDSISSYVRNGINVDDGNGIYVVTRDQLMRVQWTGDGFSRDPAQGTWQVDYPPGDLGSGTTPVLMGFGEDEDNLILIGDGESDDPRLMLFWRNDIPADWEGIDGYDRRVAAVAEVTFEPGAKSRARIENSPAVMGWGIFVAPESPRVAAPEQGSVVKNFLAEAISTGLPGREAVGGAKWEWDSQARKLEQVWMTPLKLSGSMCSASRANGLLYCIGRRDGDFTLEAIDWQTGRSAFHYVLGPSMRYFAYNNLVVTPDGAVDLHSWLGMGLVRIQPN